MKEEGNASCLPPFHGQGGDHSYRVKQSILTWNQGRIKHMTGFMLRAEYQLMITRNNYQLTITKDENELTFCDLSRVQKHKLLPVIFSYMHLLSCFNPGDIIEYVSIPCIDSSVREFGHEETRDSFYADDEKIMGMTGAVNSSGSCSRSCTLLRGQ